MSYNRNTVRAIDCSYCHATFHSTVFVERPKLIATEVLYDADLGLKGEAVGTVVSICPFCGTTNRTNLRVSIDPTEIILRSLDNDQS